MKKQIGYYFLNALMICLWMTPALAQAPAAQAPVQCKFLSVDNDAEVLLYEVKINTEKALKQADLKMKTLDASGKVLGEAAFLWQNNVKGTIQPIEKGKTYLDKWVSYETGTVKGECRVTTVHFTDGSTWSAK